MLIHWLTEVASCNTLRAQLYRKTDMSLFILFAALVLGAVILAAFAILKLRRSATPRNDVVAQAKERARQRKLDRQFMDTQPEEDPYDRAYDLSLAMSATEVDESANGYGMLDDEQKRVIAAIFDNHAQVPTSLDTRPVHGARWSHSVFGELNQLDPIPDKDIWSMSRN